MPTYRISTSAELSNGAREETFDVEGDYLTVAPRGGLHVMRRRSIHEATQNATQRRWWRSQPIDDELVDVTVAFVPIKALISCHAVEVSAEVEQARAEARSAIDALAELMPKPEPGETFDAFMRRTAAWWRARGNEGADRMADDIDELVERTAEIRQRDAERTAYMADGPEGDDVR